MRKATAPKPPSFAALVQQFFTEYLVAQRALSPRTVASYRDALMLFLDFAGRKLDKVPTAMQLGDMRPELILGFLDHLEHERKNTVRSRNLRLTALRAFLKFAARRDVSSLQDIERALAVPMKRFERPMLGFLSRAEMMAVLGQPGTTWSSQRDHLLTQTVNVQAKKIPAARAIICLCMPVPTFLITLQISQNSRAVRTARGSSYIALTLFATLSNRTYTMALAWAPSNPGWSVSATAVRTIWLRPIHWYC